MVGTEMVYYAVGALASPMIGGTSHWSGPVIGAILLSSLQQIVTVARRVQRGDLESRVPEGGRGELAPLAALQPDTAEGAEAEVAAAGQTIMAAAGPAARAVA